IVGEHGEVVGEHDGFWRFTPGQRKGIGVVAERPLFVLGSDARTNTVRVGPRESLARTHVAAVGKLYVDVERADAKLRYRSPAVAAAVGPTQGGSELELDEPAYGMAPAQAAVLSEGAAAVGRGVASSGGAT